MTFKEKKNSEPFPNLVPAQTKATLTEYHNNVKKAPARNRKNNLQVFFIQDRYNMLQHLLPARSYIQQKYGLRFPELELLLRLAAYQYFSYSDFKAIPKRYTHINISRFVNGRFIKRVKNTGRNRVFTLTRRATIAIELFYDILSGEKVMPISHKENEYFDPKATTLNQASMRALMQDMHDDENRPYYKTEMDEDDPEIMSYINGTPMPLTEQRDADNGEENDEDIITDISDFI